MHNENVLVTDGMFLLEAFQGGQAVEIKNGKSISFMVPEQGDTSDDAMAYEGDFNAPHGHINWNLSDNSQIGRISMSDYIGCYGYMVRPIRRCGFFCRVGEFFGNMFGRYRLDEEYFYQSEEYENYCNDIQNMLKQYGVENAEDFYEASDDEILAHFGVSSIEELREQLKDSQRKRRESNYASGNISYDELRNYVYDTGDYMTFKVNRTGWHNIDTPIEKVMAEATDKSNIQVKLNKYKDADVRLVFRDYRAIMLPDVKTTKESGFIFKDVPRNESVALVAISYKGGKPLLNITDIMADDKVYELDMQYYSIEEFKNKLSELNML